LDCAEAAVDAAHRQPATIRAQRARDMTDPPEGE
jgi:hypothetical protein